VTDPRTTWRLVAIAEGAYVRQGLDVLVSVDTTADMVVDAIERAARDHGIRLERVDEPAPERSTSSARAAGSTRKATGAGRGPNVVQGDEAESF
jgi:hypothetical protein